MNADEKKGKPHNTEEYQEHSNTFLILSIIIDSNGQVFADFLRNYFDEAMKYSWWEFKIQNLWRFPLGLTLLWHMA